MNESEGEENLIASIEHRALGKTMSFRHGPTL